MRLTRTAASIGSGSGAGDIDIVSIAEAGTKLSDIVLQEAGKLKEQAQNGDNESGIRKQFLDNAITSIRTATFDQYNIVICTDYEQDDFQDLQGQILLLKPIYFEVKKDVLVNFKVYIFDTGLYIRHGKRDGDAWSWWGESKTKIDPVSMQVYFEKAQPKKNADDINALMSNGGAQNTAAADADAAAKQAEEGTEAANVDALNAEAEQKAKESHKTENEVKKEKQEDDRDELSDDADEASDDEEEECDDVEEKGSEDEDARSEDLEAK